MCTAYTSTNEWTNAASVNSDLFPSSWRWGCAWSSRSKRLLVPLSHKATFMVIFNADLPVYVAEGNGAFSHTKLPPSTSSCVVEQLKDGIHWLLLLICFLQVYAIKFRGRLECSLGTVWKVLRWGSALNSNLWFFLEAETFPGAVKDSLRPLCFWSCEWIDTTALGWKTSMVLLVLTFGIICLPGFNIAQNTLYCFKSVILIVTFAQSVK